MYKETFGALDDFQIALQKFLTENAFSNNAGKETFILQCGRK